MKKFFLLFVVFGFLAVSSADATEYVIDKAHSTIGFSIKHMVTMVRGNFKDFDGTFSFDEKKPGAGKVKVTIQTASINTNNEGRDKHLQTPDFFDGAKYPTLTFVSKKVTANGDKQYKVVGDLTMRGATKPVTLDVEYLGADAFMDMDGVGFSATAKIDRRDFGLSMGQDKMTAAKNLMVGNDVNITLDIAGTSKASMEKMKKKQKEKAAEKK